MFLNFRDLFLYYFPKFILLSINLDDSLSKYHEFIFLISESVDISRDVKNLRKLKTHLKFGEKSNQKRKLPQ